MRRVGAAVAVLTLVVLGVSVAGQGAPERVQFGTYGMPPEAVWKPVIEAFCAQHNCVHVDTDMSSGEAITKFLAERNRPVAYATEAGITFGRVAAARGAALAYRNANWDKIPQWAKDPQGHWFAVYAGIPTILVNPARVSRMPQAWRDLLNDEYRGTFGIKDPRTSGTALATVLAANHAMGGSLSNLKPGIDFFKQLKAKGILSPVRVSDSNIQKGEIPLTVKYDHENLVLVERFKDDLRLEIIVPRDGTIYTPSILILNRFAPRQDLIRAFADFVTSDKGQLLVARAFARPIRYVAGNLTVPEDVLNRWVPDALIRERVRIPTDWDTFSMDEFVDLWTKDVAP